LIARPLVLRAAGVLLLAAVPLQFASFYSGYLGGYRLVSAAWFSGGAREAVRATMARAEESRGPIYVSRDIEWVDHTWRFYATADKKNGMIDRASYVSEPPPDAANGTLFLCPIGSTHCRASVTWHLDETVTSIDGSRSFHILRRMAGAEAAR
jgi:hypothetical protein